MVDGFTGLEVLGYRKGGYQPCPCSENRSISAGMILLPVISGVEAVFLVPSLFPGYYGLRGCVHNIYYVERKGAEGTIAGCSDGAVCGQSDRNIHKWKEEEYEYTVSACLLVCGMQI